MRSRRFPLSTACAFILLLFAVPVRAQATFPSISAREYVSGSVRVKVTGSFSIDDEVAINTKASLSDGVVTWLQFGASGSDKPNALITYGETKEIA
ncbi:MAG: hypothetical protein ACREOG_21150 [Gemmatimonadaceae bacterium]